MSRVNIFPGQRGKAKMPASEVCMHMHIVGEEMEFLFLSSGRAVQLFKDGREFSSPILPGEAGLFQDHEGYYYDD